MRILMTTDTVGGVWSFTKELAGELLSDGCPVALVSVGRAPNETQQSWGAEQGVRWGPNFRFEALEAPLEWMTDNKRAFSAAAPEISRIAAEFEAEMLLSSQYCFGALACEIPRIVVAHSDVLSWAEACRPQGLEDSAWLATYIALVSEGLVCADAVVAPTHWMLHSLGRNFPLPHTRRVIPNGRNLPQLDHGVPRKMQAVTAGRVWDEAKNLRMLQDVDAPMPMLIVGETEFESAQLLLCGGEARLLGPLHENALFDLFRESAIYICTSRYEPFGLAPLEAALCGCAVLANDIASMHEVWGDAALYFSGPESLSDWLRRLSDHGGLLGEAQTRATTRAREFTASRMAKAYSELFGSIHREVRQEAAVKRHVA